MNEEQIQDFHLRNQAMEYATRLGSGYSPNEVLAAARSYYAFMKGGPEAKQETA